MIIEFDVASTNYSLESDTLTAVVFRAYDEHRDDERNSLDAASEIFHITADFCLRNYKISDQTPGDQGDVEPHYPAQVLAAFMTTFKDAYEAAPHESSPGDIEPSTLFFHIDA